MLDALEAEQRKKKVSGSYSKKAAAEQNTEKSNSDPSYWSGAPQEKVKKQQQKGWVPLLPTAHSL